jgi:hypothetical protein
MSINFKITRLLLHQIRTDLARPHPFAFERVGFISAGVATAGSNLWLLAREYRPVDDNDYLPDHSVGAMMGPEAIRKALQWAMRTGQAMFHVHTHGGDGLPGFSGTDLREHSRFMPNFFQFACKSPHGALVLSNSAANGVIWLKPKSASIPIDRFTEVGMPIKMWRAS